MADGNMGSLWMSLGIKETVSDGLKKVQKSLDKTDEKTASVSKEIDSILKTLKGASVPDSFIKSLTRIGELLSTSTSGAENLGRVLKGLDMKEISLLGGKINMSNLEKAHSLIMKIMGSMSSKNMSGESLNKFFDLGNAQVFLSQIISADKNLKMLKEHAKGITDEALKGDAKSLIDRMTGLRKQLLESFNSGTWRESKDMQSHISNATNSLIQFYDKLNAKNGTPSLFDSVPKEAAKATEALKETEVQAKKTAEAVASIGEKKKPAVVNDSFEKAVERMTKNPVSMKEGMNDVAGIKKEADKANESVVKLKFALNEVLNAFRGSASKGLGVGEAGEKGRQFVDILNQINKKIEQLSKTEGGEKSVAELKAMVNNALSYKELLDSISRKYKEISDIRNINPNVDTKKINEALALVENFRKNLVQLEGSSFLTGVDKANVLPFYQRVWKSTMGDASEITKGLSNQNTLSDLKSKADKANSAVSTLETNISKLERAIDLGKQRGFNTDRLFDNLAALRNRKAEFDRVLMDDPKRLNNKAYMEGLYSETARDLKLASEAMKQFGQVQQKVTEQEKSAAAEYARRNAAEKQRQSAREAELKEMDAYAKRYMELVAARDKAMASMKEAPGLKNDGGLRSISNEIDTLLNRLAKVREDITLYNQAIGNGTKESIAFGQQGLKEANTEAERLMATIENLQGVYNTLRNSQAHVDDLVGNTFAKKRSQDTLAKMSEFYKAEEKASAKKAAQDEAQAKRDAAKATREQNAAEKQRQSELENSLRRIQSMEKALANLQEKRFTSKMFGFDTTEADAKIFATKIRLNELYDIVSKLEAKDMSALGKLGNLGNGREVQAINNIASSYDRANKEAQRGIDLEQKRQQEIAKSAAKARNDLAAAFAGANAEAKKMQSIVGDIKSLFLQGGIVFGAQQFFNSIVQTGGEIVQQHIALRSILGDVQKADELFAQTQQLALQSPFKFGELNRDVKQLAAFGVEANDLYDTTKRLADIASGLGVSFERLGLAYGQVKARSWLDGKELRQFAYAGLPLLQRITEMYNREGKNGRNNYTEADVKKMISARGVSFNDVQKVLWEMTDEGGQFYNMQLVLSETLLGRWNKLIDAWDIMLGKFADGKNVVGGTFSFMINRVTDLILALDKLSPAIMSFGAIFAARKLAGFASSKLSVSSMRTDYASQLNAQLRSYAIEQQKLVTEGKIKQEIAAQNVQKRAYMLADETSLKASFSRMALEGKMSVLQMQRALKEDLIDKALVKELATMGMITAKQEQIILNGGRTAAVFNMAGSKLSGFFNMLGGWWGIAITAISSLVMAVSQYSSKIEQETKTMTDSARQNAKRIDDFLASTGTKPTDREGLKKDIDGMKDLLEQSNLYTDTIKEQVDRSGDLAKQYDVLKEKIIEARKVTKFDEQFAGTAVNAVARSGQSMLVGETLNESGLGKGWFADTLGKISGLFNDDLETNANELAESLNRVSLSLSTAFDESQKKKIEAVADSMLPASDRTKSLEEKIATLRDKGGNDWDNFVSRVASGDKDIEKHLENVGDASKGMMSDLNEIAEDDVPKMIAYLQQSLHLYGKDFEDWCKRNPHKYAQMWDDMLAVAKVKAPAIADIIKRLAMSAVGIVSTDDRKGGGKKSYNSGIDTDFASVIRNRLFKNGTVTGKRKKGKFWVRELDSALRQVQDDSWETTGENVRKKLKEARNELDMLDTGKADKNSKHYRQTLHDYNLWKSIADAGYISDDLGKNKVTGNFGKDGKHGRQEDKELKAFQERLSAYKSARQMYQKYKTLPGWGEDKAKSYVESLYTNIAGLDLNNYEDAMKKLQDSLDFNKSEERKKALTSLKRELGEWRFSDVFKPELDRIAADFTESLNKGAKQFNLYKSILEKTGNKDFASRAFVDGVIWDDQARSLAQQFNDLTKGNKILDVDATEATAKKYLEDVNGAYDLWKQIADLVHGNYSESLTSSADLIKEALDYEERIVATREKYNKLIENANKVGNSRAAVVARQQMEKEIGKINLDKFKNSSDYLNFYGAIVSLGEKKARSIAEQIRRNINDALQSGAIDAREYAKELKQLEEQLDKLSEVQPSFFHGGLNGIISSKKNKGNDMFTQGSSQYNTAKQAYDVFQQLGNNSGMNGAQMGMNAGQSMMDGGEALMQGAGEMEGAIAIIDTIIHGINDLVQGLNDTFQDVKETAEALGADTESDGWTDANSFFSGFASASASATKGWDSLKNGDIGGVISGVVGSFTGWIKAFAAGHDAKLDRQIKLAERQLTELKNISSNINSEIEKTLGGIYSYKRSDDTATKLSSIKEDYQKYDALAKSSFGKNFLGGTNLSHYSKDTYDAVLDTDRNYSAYADQLALLKAQKDELKKQQAAEEDKKKKDQDKIADYKQQITEMELQISTFAQDFLKDIYSIDMKSWASQLTDAVVGAWEKGEDAVDAYRDKVKDMVKDVTKNIVTQKIMEKALEKPLGYLTGILEEKGKLDESDVDQLANMLYKVGDETIPQITGIFDALKNRGWDLRENGSSSTTNSIKGITEETADLLASYINSIRLDVSVNRENIKLIADSVTSLPELNVIAQSQLTAMNQLVSLAEYRNSKLDDMYSWMRAVTSGTGTKSIRMN